jgi:hypothetical protein
MNPDFISYFAKVSSHFLRHYTVAMTTRFYSHTVRHIKCDDCQLIQTDDYERQILAHFIGRSLAAARKSNGKELLRNFKRKLLTFLW